MKTIHLSIRYFIAAIFACFFVFGSLTAANMTYVSVTPSNFVAGVSNIHRVSFTTVQDLPSNGKIVITYPAGFYTGTASIVTSNTISGTLSVSGSGNIVTITRSGISAETGGETETIQLANITNDTLAGIYTVLVETKNNSDITLDTGSSSAFTIIHSTLDHFSISGVGTQTAGNAFTLTITAKDINNNTVTGFTGNVNITSTGTLSSGGGATASFSSGVLPSHSVTITNTGSFTITATKPATGETGTSTAFTVNPGALSKFLVEASGGGAIGPQTAGTPFTIRLTAQDANNNTFTGFTGNVNITSTGTLSSGGGATASFSSGVLPSHSVTITNTGSFTITATKPATGETGSSNPFTVNTGVVAKFLVEALGGGAIGSQTAGTPFTIRLTAQDVNNNTATGFTGNVNITSTGTLSSGGGATASFSSGVLPSHSVTITNTGSFTIMATKPATGETGSSNPFTVNAGTLHHFSIDTIGNQVAGIPFTLYVTAMDRFGSQATSFIGKVVIHDLTGKIKPDTSGLFRAGQWSGGVTIDQAMANDQVSVVRTGGTENGSSNSFMVNAPPGVKVVGFTASRKVVTAGQDQDWTLALTIRNLASSNARYDSLKIRFLLVGAAQSDYQLVIPTLFNHSHTAVLGGNQQDTLSILVDKTGRSSGDLTVNAVAYFTDSGTGRVVQGLGYTGITVQDSADLKIERIRVSQSEVTVGQEQDWTATLYVTNLGGSDVVVDSSLSKTFLTYSIGAGWKYLKPQTLGSRGWTLRGYETDSLTYIIEKTGSGNLGICEINASLTAVEVNTGRIITANTQISGKASILIESQAALRILGIENLAPNGRYVNGGQNFTIRTTIENPGGDGLHNVLVKLETESSIILDPSIKAIESMPGGMSRTVEFLIQAPAAPIHDELFTITVDGYSDNNPEDVNLEKEDTTHVTIQNPANLFVQKITTSSTKLIGGQKDPWTVKVIVRNLGQASLVFDSPKSSDISFWNSNLFQVDYTVNPPTGLTRNGLILSGGATDTLIYSVTTTGSLGGNVEIRAKINAKDKNSQNKMTGESTASVYVKPVLAFRIISTTIETLNKTEAGNGYVNVGQEFKVRVNLENGLGLSVNAIQIQLKTDGASEILNSNYSINLLKPSQRDSAFFRIKADQNENFAEFFSSQIIQAKFETSGVSVPVGASLDSVAQGIIQKQAKLALSAELSNSDDLVSIGQNFEVKATLRNLGTSELASPAVVQVALPEGYKLLSVSDTLSIKVDEPVEWMVRAPDFEHSIDWISMTVIRVPNDKNTGNPAEVAEATSRVSITTVASLLSTHLTIVSPQGARDSVVSTGQNFILKADVFSRNAMDVTAKIVLPTGYTTVDDTVKSVRTSEVIWVIEAPSTAAPRDSIRVQTNGVDSLQPDRAITGKTAAFPVTTVWRAELVQNLDIIEPPDVVQNKTVSIGQEFTIEARLTKLGDADTTGIANVTLETLPEGYTTRDMYTKTCVNGKATWRIKAPMQQTAEAVNISVKLTTLPFDENTNKEAFVQKSNGSVPVTMAGAWLAVIRVALPSWVGSTVIPGQAWIRLMALEVVNRGSEGTKRIVLESIKFQVEDRFGNPISPLKALSEITVTDDQDSTKRYGTISDLLEDNPLTVTFTKEPDVLPNERKKLAVFGKAAQHPGSDYFQLNIPVVDYVNAKDADSRNSIPVKSESGEEWTEFRSEPKKIFKPETEPVLWNCPNPFSPDKGSTSIMYFLEKNTDVTFGLYTLIGELVWTESFMANESNGSAGMHTILWDGRNGQRRQVLNGVYLLFMKTADGKVVKTKIAVVK
jgi:hypothetical protein